MTFGDPFQPKLFYDYKTQESFCQVVFSSYLELDFLKEKTEVGEKAGFDQTRCIAGRWRPGFCIPPTLEDFGLQLPHPQSL